MKRNQHMKLGALSAGSRYFLERKLKNESIDMGHLFIRLLLGAGSATLADLIEPAAHPNHRATFHSLAVAIGIWVLRNSIEHSRLSQAEKSFLEGILDGYFSHIAADAFTPKGIPFI